MTQQNAAMVEESTAASHALNGEAEQLAALVGRFRTAGGDDEAEVVDIAKARGRTKDAAASGPKPTFQRAARAAAATGGRSGGEEPAASNEWHDF